MSSENSAQQISHHHSQSNGNGNLLVPGFRTVPKTGVIYVMDEAAKVGYTAGSKEWANLGQGSPETGVFDPSIEMLTSVPITPEVSHYSAVSGIKPLREAVANMYNEFYRQGKASKYTYENVCICPGGRAALTRLVASMSPVNIGHFIPDYTAYEELLTIFRAFNPIPILCEVENNFRISVRDLRREIVGRGLSAVLASNPCNPTGTVVEGEELAQWIRIARECHCSFIIDEIYSHYIYSHYSSSAGSATWKTVSAAQFVNDVNVDPVIILDGLTKSWRVPGLRCCWVVAPKSVIDAITSSGTFLDGGANHAVQQAALPLLNPDFIIRSTTSLQKHFSMKREYLLQRLASLGLSPPIPPSGTFYAWVNLADLPAPLNDGNVFFRECLKEKVIVVPGVFFDVNPGNRRTRSRFTSYVRLSFGPEMEILERGLDAIERVVRKFAASGQSQNQHQSQTLSGRPSKL